MFRILLVAALLALPAFAHAAPVCVGPSLLTVCANVPDEPFVVDVGEVRAENGTATAVARADVAAGAAGPAVFEARFHFAQATSPDGHEFVASLAVITQSGIGNSTYVSIPAPAASPLFVQSGTMRVTLTDDDLLADGGSVVLQVQQVRFGQTEQQLLGYAESRAPVTVVATPEARTLATADVRTGDTFTVGTAYLERGLVDVALHDGSTVVATGTALRMVLDGTLNLEPIAGPWNQASAMSYASLMVSIADGPSYMVARPLTSYSCWSACTIPGHAGPWSLELLVPGDALDARRPITVNAWVSESHSAFSGTGYQAASSHDSATGRHVAYVVGA